MHLRLVCVDGRTSLFLILIFFHFSALRINVGFEVLAYFIILRVPIGVVGLK